MAYEPLGFVSGGSKGSQLSWAVVDKEACCTLSDHRNLTFFFGPAVCTATLSKLTSQGLLSWFTFMSEFSYGIRHIPDAENPWGDLLTRLRSVGGGAADSGEVIPVCVRSIPVVAPADANYFFGGSTIGEGGDSTIASPGRSPKQPLPGMRLHDPLHCRQACPKFIAFDQGVGQICPQ